MTPEQAARFVLSDCQDPELKALAEREMDERFAAAMRDPAFKAQWDAKIRAFADEIDRWAVEDFFKHFNE